MNGGRQAIESQNDIVQVDYMIKWYKNLYVGDNAKKKERKIRHKVENGKVLPGIYLITYAQNEDDQLDIFPASSLRQKVLYHRCPEIIGIASGYDEAVKIVMELADKVYRQKQCKSIKHYLEEQE